MYELLVVWVLQTYKTITHIPEFYFILIWVVCFSAYISLSSQLQWPNRFLQDSINTWQITLRQATLIQKLEPNQDDWDYINV